MDVPVTLVISCSKLADPLEVAEVLCITSHHSPEFCAGNEAWWRTVDTIGAKFGAAGRGVLWGAVRKKLGFLRSFHHCFVEGE